MAALGRNNAPDYGHIAEGGALRDLAAQVKAMMAKRLQCQQCLASLAEEQESFLRDIQTFARAQGPVEASTAERAQRESAAEASTCSRDDTQESSHRDVRKSAGAQWPAEAKIVEREQQEPHVETSASQRFPVATSWSSDRIRVSTLQKSRSLGEILGTMRGERAPADQQPSRGSLDVRAVAGKVLHARLFEPAMGLLIIINAANIGWTIERELANRDTHWNTVVEVLLLAVFVAELALRLFVEGIGCLRVRWNLFDCLLIITTITVMVFFEAVAMHEQNTGSLADLMKSMLVLRLLRLLRLVRALRLLAVCRPLWKLVEGLKHCMGTMIAALALLAVAFYLFACFGAEVITKAHVDDAAVGGLVAAHFSSLPMIILTLIRFISMDSATNIYLPLIVRSPALCMYFLLLVVTIPIALMNLITAVVVEDAVSTTKMDVEMKKHFLRERLRELRPAFKELFRRLDTSGNDMVEVTEIVDALQSGLEIPNQLLDVINPGRMLDFFDLLDQDDDGGLTENEFVEGLSCVAVSEVSLETMQILHVLRSTRRDLQLLLERRTSECAPEMPFRDGRRRSCSSRDGRRRSSSSRAPQRLTPMEYLGLEGLTTCSQADFDSDLQETWPAGICESTSRWHRSLDLDAVGHVQPRD